MSFHRFVFSLLFWLFVLFAVLLVLQFLYDMGFVSVFGFG